VVKALNRKLLRDLKASAGMLAAIVGIMVIGVACFVSLATSYRNLCRAQTQFYARCRMADFWIELKKAPLSAVRERLKVPGIQSLEPRIVFRCTADIPGSIRPVGGLVVSLPDRREAVLNDIILRKGRYFSASRPREVILNAAFAEKHRLKPGQVIQILANQRLHRLHVVGIAVASEFVYLLQPGSLIPDPAQFGVFFIKRSFAEEIFDFSGACNQLVGKFDSDFVASGGVVLAALERILAPYGVLAAYELKDQPSNRFLMEEIEGLGIFVGVIPPIFLLAAALVLQVLMRRVVDQEQTVIGTLKAFGTPDRVIFLYFVKWALVIGLLSGFVGGAAGYAMAEGMVHAYRQFYEFPQLENRVYLDIWAIAFITSLLAALGGTLQGAIRALQLQPAEAMRPQAPARGGPVFLEKIPILWARLSTLWRLAVRQIFRHKRRVAVGVFATAVGSAWLVNGLILAEGAHFLTEFQFRRISRSDFEISLEDRRSLAALLELKKTLEVDRIEPVLAVPCTFVHKDRRRKGAVTGLLPGATLTVPHDRKLRRITVPECGLVVSRKIAEVLSLKPGEALQVELLEGNRRIYRVPVSFVADSYLGMEVFADIRHLSRLLGEPVVASGFQFATDSYRRETEPFYQQLKQIPAIEGVTSRRDLIERLEQILTASMGIFINVLILFAGTLFLGSLVNFSLIGLAERRREIATLYVLGYRPWEIGGLFFRENLVITLIGTVLGMPIGYLLSVLLAKTYDTELFRFPVVVSLSTWLWVSGLALLFLLISQAIVYRRVVRSDWVEWVKTRE